MAVEVSELIDQLKNPKKESVNGFDFYLGQIGSNKVVINRCGVGKVYSSSATAVLLSRYKNVSLVINLGVAGGISKELNQGDFALATACIQHDFITPGGIVGLIGDREKPEFECCGYSSLKMASKLADLKFKHKAGIIVSGDQFIACKQKVAELATNFNAIACDMETAAIAQVCDIFKVPFLGLRSISDNADNSAVLDFDAFCAIAAKRSIEAVSEFLQ